MNEQEIDQYMQYIAHLEAALGQSIAFLEMIEPVLTNIVMNHTGPQMVVPDEHVQGLYQLQPLIAGFMNEVRGAQYE